MNSAASAIILMLGIAWLIQFGFSYWQLRRYYKRIAQLRRDGLVWIGMEGSAWKRRVYAALVIDQNERIVHAEQLSGWTILAGLKPIPGLAGRPISDLLDDQIDLQINKKLLLALRNALKHRQDIADKAAKAGNDTTSVSELETATTSQPINTDACCGRKEAAI
ncbi:MAG: transcriptional regulator [Anaerolineae bacterium]|nr:transcriptional regulator [Anaerolineae bacterium]